ncbi:plasmid replication protein, CyRepA1 family [Limnothrix sp. PR1529]|uniref:plasmid replication protein, CyRepA1 family n=1 Tax=Limnothrix sp. PR1529 TaxID=1704291 RepID=UPI000C1563BA|nr:plasmid replication protein, CyRepA1 family [Limnothrix sp. PR1529]
MGMTTHTLSLATNPACVYIIPENRSPQRFQGESTSIIAQSPQSSGGLAGLDPIAHFRHEFCQGSAIAPELFAIAVQVRHELETNPYTHEAEGWPIHEALGWKPPSRDYQTRKPHRFSAGAFLLQESGEVWQIKPQNPRPNPEKPGRFNKYETPTGAGSRAYLPPINRQTLRAICKRHGLYFATVRDEVEAIGSFWGWVASRADLPIILTEGAKKALSLLSNGFIAIGLTGCTGGYRATDDIGNPLARPHLIADLQPFASQGRTITIALDRDLKRKTIQNVWKATHKLARLLEQAACTVTIARWDNAGGRDKGVDDLIVNQGIAAWEQALATARPLRELAILHKLQNPLGSYEPSMVVDVPDLAKAIDPRSIPSTGTVVLGSKMGTAKTKMIRLVLDCLKDIYPNVIAPGHREALQRGLADRLGLDYLHDTDRFRGQKLGKDGQPTKRLSLCWDSLLSINPADYPPGSYIFVMDEADQGLRHLILGATCGKDGKRPALMERAIELIKNAGLVILASADLTAIELDFIASIRNEQPWILENTYQLNCWPVEFIGSKRGLARSTRAAKISVIARLSKTLRNGRRVFLVTDTQATAERIEHLALELGLKNSEILRFDRNTSADPLPRAFAENPDQFLSEHRIRLLICSPALTSGVSIEGDYFDRVYGIFEGQSIAPWDAMQQLGRVRKPVPRIVYAAWFGRSSSLSQGRWVKAIQKDIDRRTNAIAGAMGDRAIMENTDRTSSLATYRNEALASQNEAMADFGLEIRLRLEAAGHAVEVAPIEELVELFESSKDPALEDAIELWAIVGQRVNEARCQGILNAEAINPETAKTLREKRVLSFADREKLERFEICDFDRIDPNSLTIEAVKADKRGKRRRAILALEDLLWVDSALTRDQGKVDRLTQWGQPLPAQDLPMGQLRAVGGNYFGWLDILAWAIEHPWWNPDDCSTLKTFADRLRDKPEECRIVFGFTPHRSMSNQQIFGQCLAAKEFKAQSKRLGTGDRQRVYAIAPESIESIKRTLNARAESYRTQGFQLRPHPLSKLLIEGVAAQAEKPGENPPEKEANRPIAPPISLHPPQPDRAIA